MWCSTCQRDVPAMSRPSGGLRCTRCERDLDFGTSAQPTAAMPDTLKPGTRATSTLAAALCGSALADADWKLEADLRGVHRLIHSLRGQSSKDLPHTALPAPHHSAFSSASPHDLNASKAAPSANPIAATPGSSAIHVVGWLLVAIGLATFVCGGVLLGWSLAAGRDDLWPLGMPLTLIGQAGLVLGLVLQLDGLWATNRKAAAAIQELNGELKQVRHATSLLSTSHSAAGQSFYLHLAEGAGPQLLLADLKGQMDLLAQQMARHGS